VAVTTVCVLLLFSIVAEVVISVKNRTRDA
jgi:hypothetical protein